MKALLSGIFGAGSKELLLVMCSSTVQLSAMHTTFVAFVCVCSTHTNIQMVTDSPAMRSYQLQDDTRISVGTPKTRNYRLIVCKRGKMFANIRTHSKWIVSSSVAGLHELLPVRPCIYASILVLVYTCCQQHIAHSQGECGRRRGTMCSTICVYIAFVSLIV